MGGGTPRCGHRWDHIWSLHRTRLFVDASYADLGLDEMGTTIKATNCPRNFVLARIHFCNVVSHPRHFVDSVRSSSPLSASRSVAYEDISMGMFAFCRRNPVWRQRYIATGTVAFTRAFLWNWNVSVLVVRGSRGVIAD